MDGVGGWAAARRTRAFVSYELPPARDGVKFNAKNVDTRNAARRGSKVGWRWRRRRRRRRRTMIDMPGFFFFALWSPPRVSFVKALAETNNNNNVKYEPV
jgi:hypothetical protein